MVTRFLPILLIASLVPVCMEVDLSAPSFPAIVRSLYTSDALVQMTIAVNFLGFALSGVLYGPLSDSFGRRKIMIYGNGLLLLGATGCVFAPTIEWLLVSRFFQGMGAAASAVVAFAIAADAYKGEKAVRLIGIMNSALTALMAIAPVLGSFVFKALGWRGSYGFVAILCFTSWLTLFFGLPETKHDRDPFYLKKILRDYKKLVTSAPFMAASFVPTILCAGYFSFIACSPFWYMDVMGLSVFSYALYQGSIVAVFSIISIISGRLVSRFGARRNIIWGMSTSLVGTLLMLFIGLLKIETPILVTLSMFTFAGGFAAIYPVIFVYSLEMFPAIRGAASSMLMAIRMIVVSGGVALGSLLYNGKVLSIGLLLSLTALLAAAFIGPILKQYPKGPLSSEK
jgi:DHA1 family bicyclomycin/chloramphenicol resistance-like MFS transporter